MESLYERTQEKTCELNKRTNWLNQPYVKSTWKSGVTDIFALPAVYIDVHRKRNRLYSYCVYSWWFSKKKKKSNFPKMALLVMWIVNAALPSFPHRLLERTANEHEPRTNCARRGDTKVGRANMPKQTGFVFYAMPSKKSLDYVAWYKLTAGRCTWMMDGCSHLTDGMDVVIWERTDFSLRHTLHSIARFLLWKHGIPKIARFFKVPLFT